MYGPYGHVWTHVTHTQVQEIGEAESTHVGINLILHVRLDVYAEFDHAM